MYFLVHFFFLSRGSVTAGVAFLTARNGPERGMGLLSGGWKEQKQRDPGETAGYFIGIFAQQDHGCTRLWKNSLHFLPKWSMIGRKKKTGRKGRRRGALL